jgi:hypothetical protein
MIILVAYVKSMKLESVFLFHAFVVPFACKVSYFLHNEKHEKSMKLGCIKSMKPDTTKVLCFCCTLASKVSYFLHNKKRGKSLKLGCVILYRILYRAQRYFL